MQLAPMVYYIYISALCVLSINNPSTKQVANLKTQHNSTIPCYSHSHPLIVAYTFSCCLPPTEVPPSKFLEEPNAGSPKTIRDTQLLVCSATGSPPAVYRWRKDGEFLTDHNVTEQSLKLADFKRSDVGMYQCIASNAAGAILSHKAYLTVACESMLFIIFIYFKSI